MAREFWKAANLLCPVPAVILTCQDENKKVNAMTAAWAGTICSDPVMVSVSIRPERYSNGLIRASGEFAMNLTNRELAYAADFCGVKSGRDTDKLKILGLKTTPSRTIETPALDKSPVSLECRVVDIRPLGSHDLFIAQVTGVAVDDRYLDEKGRLDLQKADLIAYSHGEYFALGDKLGKFGFSVRKRR